MPTRRDVLKAGLLAPAAIAAAKTIKGFYPLREFFGTADVRYLLRGSWGGGQGPCPRKVLGTQGLRVKSCEQWS